MTLRALRAPPDAAPRGLLLGVDAGGTAVHALVADAAGDILGTGQASGANPVAVPLNVVADHLSAAVSAALGDADPARITAAVVGVPGVCWFGRADGAASLRHAWQRCGLRCQVRVVADPVVAFAGGTAARRGAVLIAGTGTIAAMIDNDEVIRRIDGHGWLVGDDGSGFWLGRQAVRAVLAELDGRAEPTVLRYAVLATLTGSDRLPDTAAQQLDVLSSCVYGSPPIALARLAALVPAAAETGDRAAQRIVDRAVTLLADTIEALLAGQQGDPSGQLVLAGTVLTAHGPIRQEVQRRITQRTGRVPLVAGSGAGGAAWLAARQLGTDLDPAIHDRLTASPPGQRSHPVSALTI